MIHRGSVLLLICGITACQPSEKRIKPTVAPITESIYASGLIKSDRQYEVRATVNGRIRAILVNEGDTVKAGTPVISIDNDLQQLNEENAALTASFSDLRANEGKLREAAAQVALARHQLENDSLLFSRQQALWDQQIGTRVQLEQRELACRNARTAYVTAQLRHDELRRQLQFNARQAGKNLQISGKLANDYIVRSEINGVVYRIFPTNGDMISPQTPLCVIGDAYRFILEMDVDEYDIFKVKPGMPVEVMLDSYKGKVFNAAVTRINPLMNERSKTFTVEATFIQPPPVLYPNISFEANIVIARKQQALLIPRNYILHDSLVVRSSGEKAVIKTGLKDLRMAEVLSGISASDELIFPAP